MRKSITGNLTLASNMFVASPFGQRISGNEKIATVAKTKIASKESDTGYEYVPYYPANGLRGALRRIATDIVLRAINENVSIDLYHAMSSGAVTGKPNTNSKGEEFISTVSVETKLNNQSNVFLGVFGGGFYMTTGGIIVTDMLPMIPLVQDAGLYPDGIFEDITAPLNPYEIIETRHFLRGDDVISPQNNKKIPVDKKEVLDWEATNLRSELENNARNPLALTNFQKYDSVIAGTSMTFNIEIKSGLSNAQIGLLLMSVRDFANEQKLGGKIGVGFGRFIADLTFYNDEGEGVPALTVVEKGDKSEYVVSEELSVYIKSCELELNASGLYEDLLNSLTSNSAKPKPKAKK